MSNLSPKATALINKYTPGEIAEQVVELQRQVDEDNERWIRVVSVIEDIRSKATPNGMIAGFMDSFDKALKGGDDEKAPD